MASTRTLAKRIEERRTWTVTTRGPDGRWFQAPYNGVVAATRKLTKVRIPSKREREAARKLREAQEEKPTP
jgi:hypothetical protein